LRARSDYHFPDEPRRRSNQQEAWLMPFAARLGDMVLQDSPHCHAPIHPPAPVPTPVPHPALPLTIIKGEPTVLIGGQPAARLTDQTTPARCRVVFPAALE
jgi:uncharacterized Zn-binding protein involved in type VI secretion